ncbi:MAG: hypothetical protein A2017_20270 [Lentisphaerae bacterium GWF2_44_16]|nr:MAG: hypothetical protein A2017_20270 [Lentisphaerae bacterium GWF2_44_16]
MISGLTLIFITGVLWGLVGIIFSRTVSRKENFHAFMLLSSFFCAAGAWAFLPDYTKIISGDFSGTLQLLAVMTGVAFLGSTGFLFMKNAMNNDGHHGIIWTIAQSAMIIPFIASFILWDEKITLFKVLGLITILLSLFMFGMKKSESLSDPDKKNGKKWFLFALSAFIFLGISQAFSTMPSHWTGWHDNASLRVPVYSLSAFLFWILYFLLKSSNVKFIFLPAFSYALAGLLGQVTLYKSLDIMSARNMTSIVYPASIAVSILIFFLYSIFIIREKSGAGVRTGFLFALAGIIMISI